MALCTHRCRNQEGGIGGMRPHSNHPVILIYLYLWMQVPPQLSWYVYVLVKYFIEAQLKLIWQDYWPADTIKLLDSWTSQKFPAEHAQTKLPLHHIQMTVKLYLLFCLQVMISLALPTRFCSPFTKTNILCPIFLEQNFTPLLCARVHPVKLTMG